MAASEDLLDAVVMADDRFHGEGFREGYQEGSILGVAEGRWHGAVQGARIGAEVAYYQGFAFTWKNLLLGRTPDDSSAHCSTFSRTLKCPRKVLDFHFEDDRRRKAGRQEADVHMLSA
ncbi:protein LTO1 homolog isoform X3 [Ochotona princeps]|uniref:protein LTO1 homolog isoform X3 n=1 Tax=Ochotona princeps TaxID=9978 RepID=UPI0027144BB1|nr:protein LTO1 homolog isoform X3 [Ochotona princeps]